MPPISVVGAPVTIGPPTCGTTPVTMGQTWLSPIREAGMGMAETSWTQERQPIIEDGRRSIAR
jgi:hypothetical protein